MRSLFILLLVITSLPALSQKNAMMSFGPGLNFLRGYNPNWSFGMRFYLQVSKSGFVSGGADFNQFTAKFLNHKTNFTTFRVGYEYFVEPQTFHLGADVGIAGQSGYLKGASGPIISIGPGLMSRRPKKGIWDAGLRYNYITRSGWHWFGIRVGYGFRSELKRPSNG